ncbi:MAG: response regulator, partial [Anaerolineae bacterium]|nr:response regulator [Anaerolineae bacterium]
NEINALLVRSVLARAGQNVTVVGTGREAWLACRKRLAEGKRFDLVLMDLHMPEMDGIEAVHAIRKLEKRAKGRKMPIMMLTADEQAEARAESGKAGADGFLTKPIDPERLVAVARSLLKAAG